MSKAYRVVRLYDECTQSERAVPISFDDFVSIGTAYAIENGLKRRPGQDQRYVVPGINNDKIELVSNLDIRKLNRLIDAKDFEWASRISYTKSCIDAARSNIHEYDAETFNIFANYVDNVLDAMIEEHD